MVREKRVRRSDPRSVIATMGDTAAPFEAVGQYYNAVSPDDSITSAHELTDARFRQLFDVEEVSRLNELLGDEMPLCDSPPDCWIDRLSTALLNTNSDEQNMNAILQDSLKEATGVEGLKTKKRKNNRSKKTVTEKEIRNIFFDFYNRQCYKGLERKNGLPVTLLSRPDFAVWAEGGAGMGITGEGKHASKYMLHNAIRQCAAYMLVHLFYWLATKSKLVESVYGVAVAGVNCKDMARDNSFAVVLMSLTLPATIGGKLRITKYKIVVLDDLWTFVNFVCGKKPGASCELQVGQGRPACLQLPFDLLQSKPVGWEIVKNGTANLVVRIDEETGWEALGSFLYDRALKELDRGFRQSVKEIYYPIYFKSKNYLATDDPKGLAFYTAILRENSSLMDLRDSYFAVPSITASGIYILMSNMGEPFHRKEIPEGLRGFAIAFVPFMMRVIDCQMESGLVHGDIHRGNLLIDKQGRLRLIDYNEAKVDELTIRKPRTDVQKFTYNESLAHKFVQFTKNQLMQLFWECWVVVRQHSGCDSPADVRITAVIGEFHAFFSDEQGADADSVDDVYEKLMTSLDQISKGRLAAGVS